MPLSPDSLPRPWPLADVVGQHVEEAAALWNRRRLAVRAPHYTLRELAALDDQLEAHLDGLRIAAAEGVHQAEEALATGDASEVFVLAALALDRGDLPGVRPAVDAVRDNLELVPGLVSALGWSAWAGAQATAAGLLREPEPPLALAGLRGHAVHRQHPGPALEALLRAADPVLAAGAARTAGELGRAELLPVLEHHLRAEAPALRFWAAWAAALLGSRRAPQVLAQLAAEVEPGWPLADRAAATAARTLDAPARTAWQAQLAGARPRLAAIAAGAAADLAAIPWLLETMDLPEAARAAGEAFALITGADLAYEDLEGEPPEDFEAGPSDDPEDERVELDPDEDLPWPDAVAVSAWWRARSPQLPTGKRCLLGRPVTQEQLRAVLAAGKQRQRLAAAEELKLLAPTVPLVECRAAGARQVG